MNRSSLSLFAVLLVFVVSGQSMAQTPVPQAIKIQGFLTDDQGAPIDGQVSMTFNLYDALSGGTLINSAGPLLVQVSDGIYSASLAFSPTDFAGQNRFVEHIVDGETLSPRTEMVSVPYAYRAEEGAGPAGPEGPAGPPGEDGQDGAADPDQQAIKDKLCEISTELSLTLPTFCTPQSACPCNGLTQGGAVWASSFPTDSCLFISPTELFLFGTGEYKRLAALGNPAQNNCNVWDGSPQANVVTYMTAEEAEACADELIAIAAEDGVVCD